MISTVMQFGRSGLKVGDDDDLRKDREKKVWVGEVPLKVGMYLTARSRSDCST